MAVTLDADGWTAVTPSSDTRTVYVSSSAGSDSNTGLSESSPVKSIGKGVSLLRSGMPDHLLLKRGDTFTDNFGSWTKSGRNAQEPMLISTYGTGARPELDTGSKAGFFSNTAFHDLAMIGLDFEANTRNPDSADYTGPAGAYGFQVVGPVNGLLVEDTSFSHYVYNVSLQGFSGYAKNIKFRRDQITDSWAVNDKCVGFYASQIDGLTIEDSLFDHNGWNETVAGGSDHLSHNIYFWSTTKNVVIRNNIIANAGQSGLQARGGAIIEGNLFLRNPCALLVGNGTAVWPGGVSGRVTNNVFIDSRDMNGSARGWAIELGNIKPDGNTLVADNIVANDSQLKHPAIKLTSGASTNPGDDVGVNDVTITRNIVYNWHQALSIQSNFKFGGTGKDAITDLVVRDNDFQRTSSAKIINQPQAFNAAEETWENNRYHNGQNPSGWFNVGGTTTSFDKWKATIEPSAQNQQMSYPDPTRDAASYNATLGGAKSVDAFLDEVRQQAKGNWHNELAARAVNAYVRAGFTGVTPSETPTQSEPAPEPEPPVAVDAAPTATLSAAPDVTAGGQQLIKVTYSDDVAVATNSFGHGDIKVTGPNGYSQAATFVSADSRTNGTPRTATYAVAAPGGAWDSADNGSYTVAAELVFTPDILVETPSAKLIQVIYTDDEAMQVNSFGNGDIRVTGPDGFSQAATLVSVDKSYNGAVRTATYAIAAPGGSWDSGNNGAYSINLNAIGVKDTKGNYAAARTLGTFNVAIA